MAALDHARESWFGWCDHALAMLAGRVEEAREALARRDQAKLGYHVDALAGWAVDCQRDYDAALKASSEREAKGQKPRPRQLADRSRARPRRS